MIDLETAGTDPDAAILSIGMVEFTLAGDTYEEAVRAEKYIQIDPESYDKLRPGLFSMRYSTIRWWLTQAPPASRAEAWSTKANGALPVQDAIRAAHAWLSLRCDKNTRVWAQGTDFDMRIMEHAFKVGNLEKPWSTFKQVDLRTYFTLKGTTLSRSSQQLGGNDHSAIQDCRNQIATLLATWHVSQMSKAQASTPTKQRLARQWYKLKSGQGVAKKKR